MKSNNISTHVFIYYLDEGIWLLNKLKEFYSGHIFLSLIENTPHNDQLLSLAKNLFDVSLTYVPNKGTDQIGFYKTFQKDNTNKEWILYLHDKGAEKQTWLQELIEPLTNIKPHILSNQDIGIISSIAHKQKTYAINTLVENYGSMDYKFRKALVESMHTTIWLKELQRILLQKNKLINEDSLYPEFCAGNVFLARRQIVEKVHDCVYEDFFNDGYRKDGEIGHGLERFYFYVSECMGYKNLYI
jgi:hypothetical protein